MNAYTVECGNAVLSTPRPLTKQPLREAAMATKKCTKCGLAKSPQDFYKNKSRCKACMDAEHAAYKQRNAVAIAAYKASWRFKNIEAIKARRKAVYYANPQAAKEAAKRWADGNRHLSKLSKKRWKKRNPHYARADAGKRRAARVLATPPWADQKAIVAIYERALALGLHVDHIVPLRSKIVCGLHCEANLQLLPPTENNKKSNRHWPDMP